MIWRSELIGNNAVAINKRSGTRCEGVVTDESYHTLTINGVRVTKTEHMITIVDETIDGAQLDMRPHDRIKARFKKTKVNKI